MEQGIATRYQAPQRADLNPCSQTCPSRRSMSAFGRKADIRGRAASASSVAI